MNLSALFGVFDALLGVGVVERPARYTRITFPSRFHAYLLVQHCGQGKAKKALRVKTRGSNKPVRLLYYKYWGGL